MVNYITEKQKIKFIIGRRIIISEGKLHNDKVIDDGHVIIEQKSQRLYVCRMSILYPYLSLFKNSSYLHRIILYQIKEVYRLKGNQIKFTN